MTDKLHKEVPRSCLAQWEYQGIKVGSETRWTRKCQSGWRCLDCDEQMKMNTMIKDLDVDMITCGLSNAEDHSNGLSFVVWNQFFKGRLW